MVMKKKAEDPSRSSILEKVEEVFTEYLGKQKLRKTPERFAILREVYSQDDHFDVESLFLHMKKKKHRISRATLYNTMEHLMACDLVARHQFGKNMAMYEKSYAYRQHDHLICNDCGKVLEFCDPRIQQIQSMIGEILGFDVNQHSLNLYGKCRKLALQGSCENLQKKKQVNLTSP